MSELSHREVLERLSPYLDDELDPLASAALAAHLRACPDCERAEASARRLRAALRTELETHAAPDRLRARVNAALGPRPATARPEPPRWTWPRWAWGLAAAAASVVLLAGGVWFGATRWPVAGEGALASEVVASHVRSLMASHLTDVGSSDQHTVKPWFDGRLDFAPPVEDLAAAGFPLVGGRLDYIGGRPVAALVYGRRRHLINLFVWPREGSRAPQPLARQGYHVVHGVAGGMEYWAVSDVNAGDLDAFVKALPFVATTAP